MSSSNTSNASMKRKSHTASSSIRKKTKTRHDHVTVNDLPWKTVFQPHEAGVDMDEGILELEEVDDVHVIYEDTNGGRVIRFAVNDADEEEPVVESENEEGQQSDPAAPEASDRIENVKAESTSQLDAQVSFDSQTLLPEWHSFSLHPRLGRALHAQKFQSPTPIQSQAIPHALEGRDLIGVAETGSGKTLAYGLPILHHLLSNSKLQAPAAIKTRRSLRALVLAPTRELALQVSTHLNACLNDYSLADPNVKLEAHGDAQESHVTKGKGQAKGKAKGKSRGKGEQKVNAPTGSKAPPLVSVAAIVGGMSAQKQRRILDRGVDVLIATPGRLWDIIEQDDKLAKDIKALKFLVLDEADRMIETGHFAELDNILRLTQRQFQKDETDPDFKKQSFASEEIREDVSANDKMQTFVFSATLSKDLQRNLKKRQKARVSKKGDPPASTLDDLVLRLDFRDPEPEVMDLSPVGGVVSTLNESKIECMSGDKDSYLYYFLLRYPGRSLVFLSSIDGIRRLLPLFELLDLPAFPLHSQLEQRQRLKNLDRFKSLPNAILLATDIAARGLDVPSVDHVVHYQIPRTADAYVHRNGRTARAKRSGFSMLMCGPDERRLVRALLGSLGRQESDIPEMSVEHHLLDKLKPRLQLAKQIDKQQHQIKKANHERNWLKATAEAMDIELDSDFASSEEEDVGPTKREVKTQNSKMAALKGELKRLLAQPLVARGVSTRYITSGSRPIVDDILAGDYHEGMVGVRRTEAMYDLVHTKKAKKPNQMPDATAKDQEAEWKGFSS